MSYNKINDKIIDELKEIVGEKNIIPGADNEDYSHDETPFLNYPPELIIKPTSEEQICKIFSLANRENIPITPRGGGTGLCGGCVPVVGGIVLSLEKMNKIKEIDETNLMAVVEAGLPLLELHEAVEEFKLLYPPDPGEKGATLGGNISTNAGGMRAVKYGVTRDYVQGIRVVTPNGDILNLGGKIVKNSSGYELIDLFIGSEGTLGIVTEATLKLIPQPPKKVSIYLPFPSLRTAITACSKIVQNNILPTATEFMTQRIVKIAEKYTNKKLPHDSAEAYIIVMLDGTSDEELENLSMKVCELCIENEALDAFVATSKDDQIAIWSVRDKFLEALKTVSEFEEVDVVAPRGRIPDFIEEAEKISKNYGINTVSFGHAGDGNIHLYLLREDNDFKEWEKRVKKAMDELYAFGLNLGGKISGEHGIGYVRKNVLMENLDKNQLKIMQNIKKMFDPNNILNPGKVIDLN